MASKCKKSKPNPLPLWDIIKDWNANKTYTLGKSLYSITIPTEIKSILNESNDKHTPVNVVYGNWMTGKSTILKQVQAYAILNNYLVFYSSEDHTIDYPSTFLVENEKLMAELDKDMEKEKNILNTSLEYQFFQKLKKSFLKRDVVLRLMGLANNYKVCIIIDRWDLVSPDFKELYNVHNLNVVWVLAGTGSWDPKSDQTRYPNNEYRHVNMISTVDVTKDFLDSVNKNPNLSTEVIMTLSNKCIGFACMILHCNTESEAESILNEFFKDKVSHLYMKLVKSRKFNAINTLKSAAIDNLKLLDHSWRLSGLVDMNCEFIHCILRKQLLQFNMCRDDLMECLQSYHFNREDVFESYMSFYFQKSNTLEIHCYQNIPAVPLLTKLFSIIWTSFEHYHGQEVLPDVVYMLKPGFPTFDYFLINKNVLYGIQVSVTDTRELHDKSESISKRIEKVRDTLLEYVGNPLEIRYVYLSLTQQRIKSDKKNTYYVPCSAPGYLNFGDEDVYQLLLEKKNIK